MSDGKDNTKLSMLFANREERDILMKNELEGYQSRGLKLNYVLDKVINSSLYK